MHDQLVSALLKHYDLKPLVIGERFRFYQRFQKAGESIADYMVDLRRLSIRCEFGDFLGQALRDIFVCGVRNEALQKKLLTEADLTIKRAQENTQIMQSADQQSSLRLKTYTGETMRIVGESTFDVSYSDKGSKSLTLAVVASSGPALLGRNYLR